MFSAVSHLLRHAQMVGPTQAARQYAVAKRKMIRKEYFVYRPKMKSRYRGNPNPRLKLLLLEDVENIGMRHDIVEVKRGIGRWDLIPNKLAVYATEENLVKLGMDPNRLKEDNSIKVPLNVLKYLQKHEIKLVTPQTSDLDQNWLISLHDISEYFFRAGRLRVPVTCMNVTESMDNVIREVGKYTVQVTLNNTITVDVPLVVTERPIDPEKN
ncbi:large ribosomal subunit protein bL9-like [Clytia hemisphaerica]|uniref:Large ribosomal subunit protein bL9m n=1 Tax=Clytia hemisphaerica TaxID=252671 RepID=A0A7M5XDH6_9CNID|eukprot:TCONS_00067352-protein